MDDLAFVIIAGVVAVATFAFIAKKYGSDCIP